MDIHDRDMTIEERRRSQSDMRMQIRGLEERVAHLERRLDNHLRQREHNVSPYDLGAIGRLNRRKSVKK
jgi:hypothetical protein